MNILFLTNILPFQRRNGGEVCSARLLARLCDVATRVLVVGRDDSIDAPTLPHLKVRSLALPATEFVNMSGANKVLSLAGAVASGQAWTAYRMSRGVIQGLRQMVNDEDFDCVFIDHLQIYQWYQVLGLTTPAVLVAHNIEHQVYGGLAQRSSSIAARWVLEREQRLLSRLDKVVMRRIGTVACLTEDDKAYYLNLARQMGVNATIKILPSYFDGDIRASTSFKQADAASIRPRRIGILGTWTWESNRLGMEWFLREVLPHIDGECEVVIAGSGLCIDQLPARVRYLGFVESTAHFYQSSDVIAIPSIAGGGIQEKTIEAIGYGVPVIATDVAVRGIVPCPLHVRVASTAREFAAACSERQGFDAAQARLWASNWNVERQAQYVDAIDELLKAALFRCRTRQGLRRGLSKAYAAASTSNNVKGGDL